MLRGGGQGLVGWAVNLLFVFGSLVVYDKLKWPH